MCGSGYFVCNNNNFGELPDAAIYVAISVAVAIAFAGLIIFYNFTMWEGNIFSRMHDALSKLPKWMGKILGLCAVCCGFWFGLLYLAFDCSLRYFVFLGVSEMILIFYQLFVLILSK